MYPKHSIVPPGGFHYTEKHAGSEIRLTGDSVDTLAAAIEKYRLNNGIPLGDPKKDVVDYICGNWSHFCNKTEFTGYLEPNVSTDATFLTRVSAWVTKLWNIGANNFVPEKEAQRRAEICKSCPLNQDFRAGCKSCIQGTDRMVFLWSKGKTIPHDLFHSLKGCRATGAHLQASVFANKQPEISEQEIAQLPAHCWRRNA